MLRYIRRNILKNKLKTQGVEKVNKKFQSFWKQIRIKQIKLLQKKRRLPKKKDPYLIYDRQRRLGKGMLRHFIY